jgi:predicted Fe-S protein YdhL (DUF1289 family)
MATTAMKMLAARAMSARATAENMPSPCISVCRLDLGNTFCEGCLRTLEEIRIWSISSDAEKKTIWARIEQRMVTTPPLDA